MIVWFSFRKMWIENLIAQGRLDMQKVKLPSTSPRLRAEPRSGRSASQGPGVAGRQPQINNGFLT